MAPLLTRFAAHIFGDASTLLDARIQGRTVSLTVLVN